MFEDRCMTNARVGCSPGATSFPCALCSAGLNAGLAFRTTCNCRLLMAAVRQCEHCLDTWQDDDDEVHLFFPKPTHLQKCAGCHKVWYCSKRCQEVDWLKHIFYCKPEAVTTAHYLALAVDQDLIPEHPQTCADYGFSHLDRQGKVYLFGLYIGFIQRIPMMNALTAYGSTKPLNPKTVHKWRVQGVLVDEIKKAFNSLPPSNRGAYYPWFLEHQWVLDPHRASEPLPSTDSNALSEGRRRAWVYAGNLDTDSDERISAGLAGMDQDTQQCFRLVWVLEAGMHPGPGVDDNWIKFGFCTCRDQGEEMALARRYIDLLSVCTFEELVAAKRSSSIPALFSGNGLDFRMEGSDFHDIMQQRVFTKSVWYLKEYAIKDVNPLGDAEPIRPSINADYGFGNCRSDEEREELRRAYRKYFEARAADPIQLHEACIRGLVYDHVNMVARLKDARLRRLMKNPYPLPDVN